MRKREVRSSRSGRRNIHWPTVTRDSVLFLTGLTLSFNEAVLRHGDERPYLIALFAGMMGLPVFLRSDESNKNLPPPEHKEHDEEKGEDS